VQTSDLLPDLRADRQIGPVEAQLENRKTSCKFLTNAYPVRGRSMCKIPDHVKMKDTKALWMKSVEICKLRGYG